MHSERTAQPTVSARRPQARHTAPPLSAKIVVSGGFGVGKTTFVGAVSEIMPLRTEAAMTDRGAGVDDRRKVASKTTTTVAMDFGRITVDQGLVLYLFGTPGQERFGFMWDDLVRGALGAIVLVDTRRLDDCYEAIDYYEARDIPFVVALNSFPGSGRASRDEIRYAMNVGPTVPFVECDARNSASVKTVLLELLQSLLSP